MKTVNKIFSIFIFLAISCLVFTNKVEADTCGYEGSKCGTPVNTCCRADGGCTGTKCDGTIPKWSFCHNVSCCKKDIKPYGYYWTYEYAQCSVGDTCVKDEEYLRPGICDDTGCTVGGKYKACCSNKKDGSRCKCSGGTNSGTCFYDDCYGPGQTLSCPISAAPPTAAPPTSAPPPTSPPGATPTPAPVGACNNCLDWGDGSNVAAWCACELLCTGKNVNPACTAAPTPAPPSGGGGGATHKVCSGTYCVHGSGSCPSGC